MIKKYVEYFSTDGLYMHHSVSTSENNKPIIYSAESHSLYEFGFLINGKVYYTIDGRKYTLTPGDIILINTHEMHSVCADSDVPYERIVMQFSPDLLPKLSICDLTYPFKENQTFGYVLPSSITANTNLRFLLEKCKNICLSNDKYSDFLLINSICELLIELNKITEEYIKQLINKPNYTATGSSFSSLAIKYINENINNKLTVTDIANYLNVSESHLLHCFKKEISIPLHKYINNKKMQTAQSLLNANVPPTEVATRLGYEYYATFYNNYYNFFNKSPSKKMQNIIRIDDITENK